MNGTLKPTEDAPLASQINIPVALVGTLTTTVKRLTSQVLLFLVAYLILVTILILAGAAIGPEVRAGLFFAPVLGIMAYVYLQKKTLDAQTRAVDDRTRVVVERVENVKAGGRLGQVGNEGEVDVQVKDAKDAVIVGIDATPGILFQDSQRDYLLKIFDALGPDARRDLVEKAMELEAKRSKQLKRR